MKVKIETILCPVDFSRNAAYATRYALELAETYDADLILLQVSRQQSVSTTEYAGFSYTELDWESDLPLKDDVSDSQTLKRLVDHLQDRHTCRISSLHRVGKPFVEILRVAEKEHADLIVMGTLGWTALKHILIGSTAEKVVRTSNCPVLTVKPPNHEFVLPFSA